MCRGPDERQLKLTATREVTDGIPAEVVRLETVIEVAPDNHTPSLPRNGLDGGGERLGVTQLERWGPENVVLGEDVEGTVPRKYTP